MIESEVVAIQGAFVQYQFRVLGIEAYLDDPLITEICINKPGEVYIERSTGWERISVPDLTFDRARQFCTAILNESDTGQSITTSKPLVSFTFPTGQRAQFVIPPAIEPGAISITIRIPNKSLFELEAYENLGYFKNLHQQVQANLEQDKELQWLMERHKYVDFFDKAVRYRKNIVIAGATGSGKTTFMKSLISRIPSNERLVTIEDARELFLSQPNVVHLLYAKSAKNTSSVTAKDCMEASLRMKPDRILLAELRGDESFFFVRNCASGHPGSITSCHAGSVKQAWEQLSLMIKASPEGSGIEYDTIRTLLKQTIDIMVHVQSSSGWRGITGIEMVNRADLHT